MAQVVDHWTMMQKVAGSNLTWTGGWKTPPVHPAASRYLMLVSGRVGTEERGMGSTLQMLCLRHCKAISCSPATNMVMGLFTFYV